MLSKNSQKILEWAYQWKMSFNPDISKHDKNIVFSGKSHKFTDPPVFSNKSPVASQKYIVVPLEEKLNFDEYVKEKNAKASEGSSLSKKLQRKLLWNALLTIYNIFLRHHLDYGDVVYDQPNNESSSWKLEYIQYNAALAIT